MWQGKQQTWILMLPRDRRHWQETEVFVTREGSVNEMCFTNRGFLLNHLFNLSERVKTLV